MIDGRLLSSVTTEFPDPLTDDEKISVNAYLVLCHACIEEFLEDAFLHHVTSLLAMVDQPLVPRDVAELFFALGVLIEKRLPYKARTRTGVSTLGLKMFQSSVINQNNGLKPDNVRKLAEGAGVPWPEFESALASELAKLTTLGAKRGEAGHLAPLTLKASKLSPRDYPDNVREWVQGGLHAGLSINRYLRDRVDRQRRCLIMFDEKA